MLRRHEEFRGRGRRPCRRAALVARRVFADVRKIHRDGLSCRRVPHCRALRGGIAGDDVVNREYDTDDNGRFATSVDELRWALRLEHRKEDAVIWLSALPLSGKDRDKDLFVLAQRLLEGMSGSETVATLDRVAPAMVSLSLSERRSAVRSLDSSPCSVSGREAWSVDADVANVDALSLSPASLSRRMRLVIIRTGFSHHPKGSADFPVFLLAGYSNAPAAFAGRLHDFNEFLSLLTLGEDAASATQTCTARAPALESDSAVPHGAPAAPQAPQPAAPPPTDAPPS
jgi:hypothetical protein